VVLPRFTDPATIRRFAAFILFVPHLALALLLGLAHYQAPVAELPFELVGNHIYLKGESDGRPVSILLDSGAGMSVLDSGVAERLKVPTQASNLPVSGAGAGRVQAQMLKGFKVRFSGTHIEQPIMIGIPLGALAFLEGRPLEAVVGFEFFQKYAINIDYENRKVRFYDPATFRYTGPGKEIPIRIQNNHPHLEAELEVPGLGKIPVEAMIDTGAGSGVNLTGRIVEAQKLDERLPKSPTAPSGAGVGGQTVGRNVRLDGVSFAGFRFEKPVASLDLSKGGATGAGASYDVLIGGDVMRRFNVIFDYSRKRMILEPNGEFAKPFPGDQVGFLVMAEGEKLRNYRVMWVSEGTPAKESGLEVGDRLVTIDGKPAGTYELYEIKKMLREPGKRWRFEVERKGERKTIELQGRSIV
jgi:predicted aspartyl protease